MPRQTTERASDTYVEEILLTKGGKLGTSAEWDKSRALSPLRVFDPYCAFPFETTGGLGVKERCAEQRSLVRRISARADAHGYEGSTGRPLDHSR